MLEYHYESLQTNSSGGRSSLGNDSIHNCLLGRAAKILSVTMHDGFPVNSENGTNKYYYANTIMLYIYECTVDADDQDNEIIDDSVVQPYSKFSS